MPQPDDQVRLRHLREAAQKAIEFAAGRRREDLDEDELLKPAPHQARRDRRRSGQARQRRDARGAPEGSWSAAARMRDRLVHHDFDINLDVLWTTVTTELPALLEALPNRFDD